MAQKKKNEWRGVIIGGVIVAATVAVLLFVMLALPALRAKRALSEVTDHMEAFSASDVLILQDPYVEGQGVIPKEAQAMLQGDAAQEWITPLLSLLEDASFGGLEKSITGSWDPHLTVRSGTEQHRLYLQSDAVYVETDTGRYVFELPEESMESYKAYGKALEEFLMEHLTESSY